MDIELARTMVRTAFESGRVLQDILPKLKAELPREAYQGRLRDIAAVLDQTHTALIAPAIAAHPELQHEIDTAIQRTGRY